MYCSNPKQEIRFTFLCRFLLSLCFLVCQSQGALQGSSEGNCRYEIKTEGYRLNSTEYKRFNALTGMDCAAHCFREFCCRSANFNKKSNFHQTRQNCELHHGLASEEPGKLERNDDYDYLVVGQERPFNCICLGCENGGTCDRNSKKCLCPTNFFGKQCQEIGKNCRDIKNKGFDQGDREYMIDPDGGSNDNAFQVYCDMTSFGGGWTMCYTTDNKVDIKREVSSEIAFAVNGYRANCNDIPFTEVMFVDANRKTKAYFTKSGSEITFNDNYNKNASTYGQWNGYGVATDSIKYQLIICDTSFYKGLHVSGYINLCYKTCDIWCADKWSPYFRTAAVNVKIYSGVAFNANGHEPLSERLVSIGLR